MKKITSFAALLLCMLIAIAGGQKNVLPKSVKMAFLKDYPTVKNVKWDAEGANFEASFKINNIDASVIFDKSGHKKETEIGIHITELPDGILAYLKQNYSLYKVTEAAKITNDKNELTYEAEVKKNGKSWDVIFDANGKFLKQEKGD